MPRQDWTREDRRERPDWREEDSRRDRLSRPERDDFGQADYSTDYEYDAASRSGRRVAEDANVRDDYGQADYSRDYAYDPDRGRGYRRFTDDDRDYGRRMDSGDHRSEDAGRYADEPEDRERGRSWKERAGAFLGGGSNRDEARAPPRRRGPSDRVLWAVIVERLEDQRGLDLRDVDVLVEDGEVTLNGTVRRKEDRRRIEDIADIEGVSHVQNNLRVRERGRWFS